MIAIRRLLMNPWVLVLPTIIFVTTVAVGWLIRSVAMRALRAWISRTSSRAGLILTEALRGPSIIWIVILAVHLAVQSSDLPPTADEWSAHLEADPSIGHRNRSFSGAGTPAACPGAGCPGPAGRARRATALAGGLVAGAALLTLTD